jgi:hypothetical protein
LVPFETPLGRTAFVRRAALILEVQTDCQRDEDGGARALMKALKNLPPIPDGLSPEDAPRLQAALSVLDDLALQGWQLQISEGAVEVHPPAVLLGDPTSEKARIRRQEQLKRDEQLAQPSVQSFVKSMERRRLHGDKWTSVYSLMRDGRELSAALRQARDLPAQEQAAALASIIAPYLEFVTEDGRCRQTGLRLQDIWRYFRHTWSNQYTSVPGRTMQFLVRDGAATSHPVIGIGALSSPIVQIRERDDWIGWNSSRFLLDIKERPNGQVGAWLLRTVDTALEEIYVDDFLEDCTFEVDALRNPTPELLAILEREGRRQREHHHRLMSSAEYKNGEKTESRPDADPGDTEVLAWIAKARTPLFRSKRALTLADLLRARMVLQRFLTARPTADQVRELVDSREGSAVVARVLRKAKGDRVGIAMADLTVCGAVPPYNSVLGGKLVCMLAVSPQVVDAYRTRYRNAQSEIASSMAGRPIVRVADLAFIGTTSLYGVGSSQYNRVRVPAEVLGGAAGDELRYRELGRSEAFGTSQFSERTVELLVDVCQKGSRGIRVNSIFGEGVSPKLRKIREGLDLLSFPTDRLLRHGRQRIVYGVTLVKNTRDYLIGMDPRPDYIVSGRGRAASDQISAWWRERWLRNRVSSDEALEAVKTHTLAEPITHGARVRLPPPSLEPLPLFDDY